MKVGFNIPSDNVPNALALLSTNDFDWVFSEDSIYLERMSESVMKSSTELDDGNSITQEQQVQRGIDKKGYLQKISRNTFMGKRWVQHPFEVSNGIIFFMNGNLKKGNQNLKGCTVKTLTTTEYGVPKNCFAFSVNGPDWDFLLAATSVEERDDWINSIKSYA